MNGSRADRVADRIRRVLASLIQEELRDPRIGFVTLTDVRLSPDLRNARAFVTVMGQKELQPTLDALNHAVPFLRRSMARRAGLRGAGYDGCEGAEAAALWEQARQQVAQEIALEPRLGDDFICGLLGDPTERGIQYG